MTVTDEMVRAALEAEYANHEYGEAGPTTESMRAALTAALGAMWRTDFENAPFMEPILLTIEGRKLPIAVFRFNATDSWRYLESGREVDDGIVPTHFMPLPAPPATEVEIQKRPQKDEPR